MSKESAKKESAIGNAAEHHISQRRQELNKRLRKWTNMLYGGSALALAGVGLVMIPWAPIAWVGVGAYWAGVAVGGVGALGVTGNYVKGLFKRNR